MSRFKQRLVVIGGGAAGFFGAIRAAELAGPQLEVVILEKTTKLLSKVKVSGGGRCNVTTATREARPLSLNYPRGLKKLVAAFRQFGPDQTQEWFKHRGVALHTEADGRVFPQTNSSQTIIDTFMREAERLKIQIRTRASVHQIEATEAGYTVHLEGMPNLSANYILVASGGGNKDAFYHYLSPLKLILRPPLPSLFTFNLPDKTLHALAGVSVPNGQVYLTGAKISYDGPILITHWGLSGPAVLKNSAFGAEFLHQQAYTSEVLINWTAERKEENLRAGLNAYANQHPKRQIGNYPLYGLAQRHWQYLLERAELDPQVPWQDAGKRQLNKLTEALFRDRYMISGKTTFKEEFVTCGGIDLAEVDLQTFEAKRYPNLYFAGEVLDIDGITGGYNFQAAWTSSYLAGSHIAKKVTH